MQGIGQNPEDNAIVQVIISMAKSLGLSVTAEGVETNEQAALLREWSCEQAQGFLFARPLDAKSITDLLKTVAVQIEPATDKPSSAGPLNEPKAPSSKQQARWSF